MGSGGLFPDCFWFIFDGFYCKTTLSNEETWYIKKPLSCKRSVTSPSNGTYEQSIAYHENLQEAVQSDRALSVVLQLLLAVAEP